MSKNNIFKSVVLFVSVYVAAMWVKSERRGAQCSPIIDTICACVSIDASAARSPSAFQIEGANPNRPFGDKRLERNASG